MSQLSKQPVLKWAGGKTQLIKALQVNLPKQYGTYYEPFIGAGALFLSVSPAKAVINDINPQLVNLYRQIKQAYSQISERLKQWDSVVCDKAFYLTMRTRYNEKIQSQELDATCAALMIWLNKHCFNGLYRVNKKGLFNVPYNNKVTGKSFDENNLKAIGQYLQTADITILNSDFEEVCKTAGAGDFVYFDSPYLPVSETADFTSYTKEGFLYADHQRLANLFKRLDQQGVQLMLSNNDVALVRTLYQGYRIQSLPVKRMINRDATQRTGQEVIITNY